LSRETPVDQGIFHATHDDENAATFFRRLRNIGGGAIADELPAIAMWVRSVMNVTTPCTAAAWVKARHSSRSITGESREDAWFAVAQDLCAEKDTVEASGARIR
jgi:hypothetical protein